MQSACLLGVPVVPHLSYQYSILFTLFCNDLTCNCRLCWLNIHSKSMRFVHFTDVHLYYLLKYNDISKWKNYDFSDFYRWLRTNKKKYILNQINLTWKSQNVYVALFLFFLFCKKIFLYKKINFILILKINKWIKYYYFLSHTFSIRLGFWWQFFFGFGLNSSIKYGYF